MKKPFVPPLSGALLGGLVRVLDLPLSLDKSQMDGQCLSGDPVRDESFLSVVRDFAAAIDDKSFTAVDAMLVALLGDEKKARRTRLARSLEQNAVLWDRMIGQAWPFLAGAAANPHAARAIARVATIDAALRAAALLHLARLPPPDEWWRTRRLGDVVVELVSDRGENVADHIGIAPRTLREICDEQSPRLDVDDKTLVKIAAFIDEDDKRRGRALSADRPLHRLRRHYAAWRAVNALTGWLERDFALECVEAFVFLVRSFMLALAHFRMKEEEIAGDAFDVGNWNWRHARLILEGRNWPVEEESTGAGARLLRRCVAEWDQNQQWEAALRCTDHLYVERHATNITAVTQQLQLLARQGAAQEHLGAFSVTNEDLWDPPIVGIVAMGPDGMPAHRSLWVMRAAERADRFHLHGDYRKALRWRKRAARIDPDDAMAHFQLGELLGELGRLDEAIAECACAVSLDPGVSYVVFREGLGAWLNEAHRSPEARRVLEELMGVLGEDASPEHRYQLAFALMHDGAPRRALEILVPVIGEGVHDSRLLALAAEAAGLAGERATCTELERRARHLGWPTEPTKRRRRSST